MNRDYRRWYSPHLGHDMELLVFGHGGAKVLVFPTRDGRFYEFEDLGIVASLSNKIDAGQLQLFCIDGLATETFYDFARPPAERVRRHLAFENYVLDEVLPMMAGANPHDCLIAAGCSFGAYQAATLVFRNPHLFRKLAAFSGRYDLTLRVEHFDDLLDGYRDEDVYLNMPSQFLPGLTDPSLLLRLRGLDIVLAIGDEDPFLDNNRHLASILADKGIPHRIHVWHGRAHSAGAWRRMAPLYI